MDTRISLVGFTGCDCTYSKYGIQYVGSDVATVCGHPLYGASSIRSKSFTHSHRIGKHVDLLCKLTCLFKILFIKYYTRAIQFNI